MTEVCGEFIVSKSYGSKTIIFTKDGSKDKCIQLILNKRKKTINLDSFFYSIPETSKCRSGCAKGELGTKSMEFIIKYCTENLDLRAGGKYVKIKLEDKMSGVQSVDPQTQCPSISLSKKLLLTKFESYYERFYFIPKEVDVTNLRNSLLEYLIKRRDDIILPLSERTSFYHIRYFISLFFNMISGHIGTLEEVKTMSLLEIYTRSFHIEDICTRCEIIDKIYAIMSVVTSSHYFYYPEHIDTIKEIYDEFRRSTSVTVGGKRSNNTKKKKKKGKKYL